MYSNRRKGYVHFKSPSKRTTRKVRKMLSWDIFYLLRVRFQTEKAHSLPFYFLCFNKTFPLTILVPLKISVAADYFSYLRVNEVLFNFSSVPTTDKYLGFRCTQLGPKPSQSSLTDYNFNDFFLLFILLILEG